MGQRYKKMLTFAKKITRVAKSQNINVFFGDFLPRFSF